MTCRLTCDTEKFELLGGEGSHHLALSEVSVFHAPFPLTFPYNVDFTSFLVIVSSLARRSDKKRVIEGKKNNNNNYKES